MKYQRGHINLGIKDIAIIVASTVVLALSIVAGIHVLARFVL